MAIIFLLLFISIAVLIHELGHFFVAKIQRQEIKKLNIGFGKALWSYKSSSGLVIAINRFPLGGSVEYDYCFEGWRGLRTDLFTLIGGPLANIMAAVFLFWASGIVGVSSEPLEFRTHHSNHVHELTRVGGYPVSSWIGFMKEIYINKFRGKSTVYLESNDAITTPISLDDLPSDISSSSLFYDLGIVPVYQATPIIVGEVLNPCLQGAIDSGDQLFAINGVRLQNVLQIPFLIINSPHNLKLQTLSIIAENKPLKNVAFTPLHIEKNHPPILGLSLQQDEAPIKNLSPIKALENAGYAVWQEMRFQWVVLTSLVTGMIDLSHLSGPLTLFSVVAGSAHLQFGDMLANLAWFNLVIALFNLMPITPLDGGVMISRILAIAYPVNNRAAFLLLMNRLGTIVLALLILHITMNDIGKHLGGYDVRNRLGDMCRAGFMADA